MGGLNVVLRAVLSGTALDMLPRFDAAAVDASRATLTSLVPTALARVDASRWRRILLGGAAPPTRLPANVVPTYGLTETCGGCVYAGVPFDGVDVRIGDRGEILLRGPVLLRAYRDGTDPKTADGWLATGDAGWLDDGVLHVDGRLSELIVTGGENVWPVAVERSLRAHPGVAECVVAGRSDPEWGERVVAWIVLAPGTDAPPSVDELRDHVKADLAPWCAPREVHVVADLPRTPSGKVRPPAG
jgi:O-succinylbenzoic acid--CoA ligase